jgi:hypothetical protein
MNGLVTVIGDEKGYHSYSARFGWEYYPKEGSRQ